MKLFKDDILKVTAIIVLLIALLNNPYGYYQILRWIIFGITCYLSYKYHNEKNKNYWFWIFITTAIVFNPILPMYLNRLTWSFINILVALLFFLNIIKFDKNRMIKIFKSKIFWLIVVILIILAGISLFVVYELKQKRIEDAKCKFSLDEITENRYFRDTEKKTGYQSTFSTITLTPFPTQHMVYWEVDSLIKNNSPKRQYLNSIILKIYTNDDKNILLTESYRDVKEWLEPNQSLPFKVRASFNRGDEILSKYFDGEEDVRIDLYPYFTSCNY